MLTLTSEEITQAVRAALAEDLGTGDVTTLAVIPETAQARADMIARQPLIVAGLEFAERAFAELSPAIQATRLCQDSQHLGKGGRLLQVCGPARAILAAERVALNFVQRLSGIATWTAQFVERVKGTQARILDTRKTTPLWRRMEKYAVVCGGGHNHRMGLHDLVLIKDNHLAILQREAPNPIAAAIRRARAKFPSQRIEVEAETPEQVQQALEAGADIILLDNMSVDELRTAVGWVAGRAKTEASGGISLDNVRAVAETGVDYISIGALTHSAPAVDIGLDFEIA